MSSVRNLYASKIQNWRPSYYFFKIRAFSFFKTRILIFVSWRHKISIFVSSRHTYCPSEVQNRCAHARRGFLFFENKTFYFLKTHNLHFCVLKTQNLDFYVFKTYILSLKRPELHLAGWPRAHHRGGAAVAPGSQLEEIPGTMIKTVRTPYRQAVWGSMGTMATAYR